MQGEIDSGRLHKSPSAAPFQPLALPEVAPTAPAAAGLLRVRLLRFRGPDKYLKSAENPGGMQILDAAQGPIPYSRAARLRRTDSREYRSRHLPQVRRAQASGCRVGQRAPFDRRASHHHGRPRSAGRQGLSASPPSASTISCATRATSVSPWSRPRLAIRQLPTACSRRGRMQRCSS
jgi:hypothetical protein